MRVCYALLVFITVFVFSLGNEALRSSSDFVALNEGATSKIVRKLQHEPHWPFPPKSERVTEKFQATVQNVRNIKVQMFCSGGDIVDSDVSIYYANDMSSVPTDLFKVDKSQAADKNPNFNVLDIQSTPSYVISNVIASTVGPILGNSLDSLVLVSSITCDVRESPCTFAATFSTQPSNTTVDVAPGNAGGMLVQMLEDKSDSSVQSYRLTVDIVQGLGIANYSFYLVSDTGSSISSLLLLSPLDVLSESKAVPLEGTWLNATRFQSKLTYVWPALDDTYSVNAILEEEPGVQVNSPWTMSNSFEKLWITPDPLENPLMLLWVLFLACCNVCIFFLCVAAAIIVPLVIIVAVVLTVVVSLKRRKGSSSGQTGLVQAPVESVNTEKYPLLKKEVVEQYDSPTPEFQGWVEKGTRSKARSQPQK